MPKCGSTNSAGSSDCEQLFPSLPLPKKYCFLFCNTKTLDEVKIPANLNLLMTVHVVRHNPLCCSKTQLNILQFFIHSHHVSKSVTVVFHIHTYVHTYWIMLKFTFIPPYYNTNITFQMINAVYAYFTLLKDQYDKWVPVIRQHNCHTNRRYATVSKIITYLSYCFCAVSLE